jgi:serine/threonine-protein kinase RsbW
MENHFFLEISSNITQLSKVEEFLIDITSNLNINEDQLNSMLISVTEAVNNAIIHGNKKDPAKKVKIMCSVYDDYIEIKIKDEGKGFDINRIPNPLLPENLTKDSGRGIFIIKSLLDSVSIETHSDGTEVTLKLNLNKN